MWDCGIRLHVARLKTRQRKHDGGCGIRCFYEMDHAFSRGLPFELGDLWRKSTFQLDDRGDTLFCPLPTDLPDLELEETKDLFKEDFHLPELGQITGLDNEQLEDVESDAVSSVDELTSDIPLAEPSADIWTLDLTLNEAKQNPHLYTWEAFDRKSVHSAERTSYLSEAGPKVFDVAVRRLESRGVESGVLPQDVLLMALCNLALGRSSLFFRWDLAKESFARTLLDIPLSGYSTASSNGLIQRMLDFGTDFRMLDDYGHSATSYKRTCTAILALKGCIVRMVDCVEALITKAIPHIRSVLQLQFRTERSAQLLKTLRMLVNALDGLDTDEAVISTLSSQVNQIVLTQTCFAEILKVVLAKISAPWLERLCVDLGLSEDRIHQQVIESQLSDNDSAKDPNTSFGSNAQNTETLPDFVEDNDRTLILECKHSLKALRRHLPDHDLSLGRPNQLRELLLGQEEHGISSNDMTAPLHADEPEGLAWSSDPEAQLGYLGTLDSRISQPLDSLQRQVDHLQAETDSILRGETGTVKRSPLSDTLDFNPIERLRPLIQTHARLINVTILRHIFWTCRLQHHLDLQKQYHLCGNGDFTARLSKALFSAETQSAERKRGVIPTGETMGLRLGTRDGQRWPPASSELRLTLDGVLAETYHSGVSTTTPTRVTKELPGGLSFSIRELPDEEIERVLDSESIYALDFLRLQYNAPPGLEAIFTPASMQAYDSIFRQLLRMLRILNVTTKLRETFRQRGLNQGTMARNARKFVAGAHHFTSLLTSHFLDIGIEALWRDFVASIAGVEKALESIDERVCGGRQQILGLDGLRHLHEQCLENIRSRLFLRRKHEKIRTGVENVFTAILNCAAALEKDDPDALDSPYTEFQDKVAVLLDLLRTAARKPSRAKMELETAEGDAEAISFLLRRLDWNGFYRKDGA